MALDLPIAPGVVTNYGMINKVLVGDCREVLQSISDNSIDAIVTDPPYELGFMGKGSMTLTRCGLICTTSILIPEPAPPATVLLWLVAR